ncbi:MAG: NAD(P)H-quinone oxidoreductase [Lentisphaerae bacterium]|nr:NAD(P)H-quinone oxidoreductase [Lentisphaerota bacterium]
MKAMILDDKLNFLWTDVPDPVRKENEVLIEVHAAAVNRADLMQKDGCYASPPDWPQWCGLEVSGIVLEAPADAKVSVGEKVCALVGGGGYSEKIAVPAGMVVPIPEGLSLIEAASIPEVWCTVYLNLMLEAGGMKPGDVFYMQAGASGVGLAAIQFAKSMGAEVITTIDSPEKAAFVKKLGADHVLDYRTEDVRPVIEAHPPTVALDCIGGKLMGECFKQMVFGGRWIMIATMAGAETTINLETVWRKRIRLIGSTLRSRTSEEKCRIMQALHDDIFPLFSSGKLITNIHAVFPIREVEAAHGVLRRAENIGKVVLTFK